MHPSVVACKLPVCILLQSMHSCMRYINARLDALRLGRCNPCTVG